MITDIRKLIGLCKNELEELQYRSNYAKELTGHWENLSSWMSERSLTDFSEAIANQYCDIHIGTHLIVPGMSMKDMHHLRAVRMLVSYQADGAFEFRSPSKEYKFSGEIGDQMQGFLSYAENELQRAHATIASYEIALSKFNSFLVLKDTALKQIGVDDIESFFRENCETVGARHSYANSLRQFFRYLYRRNYSASDLSVLVLPDNFDRHSRIPTTYTEEEISRIIASPDRSSAIGKRDYLVLLLAAEYGWRSADITGFKLDQIDWDNNVIRFDQQKTGIPVEYPLLSSVGNAIIDYLQHGRPVSDSPEVILSAEKAKYGKPLKSPTIHSIVTRYMKQEDITGWKEKKHGAHSLRHSLATNLLKKNVSLPVISTVLGHQATETTKIYLKVDIDKLRTCALKMPEINSPFYKKGGE